MALLTPATVQAVLTKHGLTPSRALGQHFLADPNTARRIVRLANVESGDRVLEIGPGVGSLTLALADAGANVVALELDRHLLPALAEVVGGRARVLPGDAMRDDLAALVDDAFPPAPPGAEAAALRCVSNLPYNVATSVVLRVLEQVPRVTSLLVMVQREVGVRLAAGPGTKDYGAVSVMVAYWAIPEVVGTVAPTVFVPRPKVESALVRLTRRVGPPVDVPSERALFALVKAGFAQRRKTLRRALVPALGPGTEAVLEAAGIDPSARAETLDLHRWAALARACEQATS